MTAYRWAAGSTTNKSTAEARSGLTVKALLDTPAASVLNRFIAFVASATGFARFDAGEIDAFGLDDLIHHYKRSARELWKFCGSSGSDWERAASALAYWQEQGDEPDWWQAGDTRGRRG